MDQSLSIDRTNKAILVWNDVYMSKWYSNTISSTWSLTNISSHLSPSFTGADLFSNCTEECKALGHSDRCWMPSFMPGDSRQGADYRSNLHVPGMDAVPDTEVQESVVPGDACNRADDRSFSTFGKDKSHHGTLTRHELHTLLPSARAPYKPTYFCEYSLKLYDFPKSDTLPSSLFQV